MIKRKIIISCEHAGNYIPKEYQYLFQGQSDILQSHRGWDIGAYSLAKYLSRHLSAPLFEQKISRLLIEMNRSKSSQELFSAFTKMLDESKKDALIEGQFKSYYSNGKPCINGTLQMVGVNYFTGQFSEGIAKDSVSNKSLQKILEQIHL